MYMYVLLKCSDFALQLNCSAFRLLCDLNQLQRYNIEEEKNKLSQNRSQ